MKELSIGDEALTIADVVTVARHARPVKIGAAATAKLAAARRVVEQILSEERVVYGVTTGFGQLATTRIPVEQVRQLQQNLVRSHAVGVGEPLPRDVVRGAMLLRVNTIAKGHSGVRAEVLQTICRLLNADLVPYIPSRGSLGASGDLAPSAHLVLAMMGEGEFLGHAGEREPATAVLAAAGIAPVTLEAKEGLALLNGTQFMAAIACLTVADGQSLLDSADVIGAMSLEGLKGLGGAVRRAYPAAAADPRPAAQRRQCARRLRLEPDHPEPPELRQGAGRLLDPLHPPGARRLPRRLALAARGRRDRDRVGDRQPADLPRVGRRDLGGNFHGEPLALALDLAAMSLAEIGSISERRRFAC